MICMAKPMRPFAVLLLLLPVGADAAADVLVTLLVLGRLRKDLGNAVGLPLLDVCKGRVPLLKVTVLKPLDVLAWDRGAGLKPCKLGMGCTVEGMGLLLS